MENLERLINEHPFFLGLKPEYLHLIAGCASNIRIKKGDFLFKEGAPAHQFYLLREGKMALESFVPHRGPVIIESIQSGEVLGWSWLTPPHRWHFDALVTEDSRLIAFQADCLLKKMEADSALGYELMKRFVPVMTRRLQATRMQMLDVYCAPPVQS